MIIDIKEAKEQIKDFFGDDKEYAEAIQDEDKMREVCDEIADSNADVYNHDLMEWLKEGDNVWTLNETIDEFGWDGCGKDLFRAIAMAQVRANYEILSEALDELFTERDNT